MRISWVKISTSAVLVISLALLVASEDPETSLRHQKTYTRHKRNILQSLAVERMLKDNGFVRSLINCVLEKGPCDRHGKHLKRMAPEILRGNCPGCTRNVHQQIRRVISHVQRNFPNEWTEVMNRFLHYPAQQFQNVFG